ncbi:hypothetical protein OAS19_06065 [Altererythrobacter sp.]|nr:hypothetical protein [Altererythrobacter sp.]
MDTVRGYLQTDDWEDEIESDSIRDTPSIIDRLPKELPILPEELLWLEGFI